ncbi:LysR family transcriptional regulator [Nitrospirillum viridazoti]|uniref:LysR family transcriptional regulator n=1 Tax=Nitrospirillum viridazoti CBAmc TaxID=1441467 RepID=A0A248K2U9_9PROT|nr:LysR family transcriptional regulator [Nitrospirillum amazonense]ASG25295.1 LysR family transcriptional regulator [Nitrospirillum amazonense CBAmc]TWB35378.1 LysR family transcriptional regulator [Nitrospirillum amazonense]
MDLHGIDLNLLVAFDALMAERSVTRAGKRIGRTQPAMSAALARLRALFKDELFVRSPSGLQPTQRASDLAEPLGRALAEISRTLEFTQRFNPATSSQAFTLALSDHPALVLLPQLTEALRERAPNVTLRINAFTHRDDAVAILDAGDADLTISVPPRQPVGGRILSQPLFEERFVCIMRRGHPAASGTLDLPTFLSLSHLLVSPEGERFGQVDAALAAMGLRRRIALSLPQMYAAPPLVAHSDLIATLMEGAVDASAARDDLLILPPPVALGTVSFAMSWHRRNDAHPVQRWFRETLSSLYATQPAQG